MGTEHDALTRFAREHHVHYEVEREEAVQEGRRELVGVEVRLFAAQPAEKLATPGSPGSVGLLGELRAFAEQVVAPAGDPAHRAEIVPPRAVLYQSDEAPDMDEVELTVRVHCDAPEHRRADAGEDRCLGVIRERLEALGVPRR
jgi:hypothetical protein